MIHSPLMIRLENLTLGERINVTVNILKHSLPDPTWEIGHRIEIFCKGQGLLWWRVNADVITIWRPKNPQPADRTVIWEIEVRNKVTNELLRKTGPGSSRRPGVGT